MIDVDELIVEDGPCGECLCFNISLEYYKMCSCLKKLMTVTVDMRVTYYKTIGTCFMDDSLK